MIEERRRADGDALRGAKGELDPRVRTGAPLAYEPPRLALIGSLEELTQGGGAKGSDFNDRASFQ
jgi:hypothetical protein